MATTTAYILSLIRLSTGAAFLAAPSFTAATFLVPQATAPAAIIATRLAGSRELVVGELLWYALRKHSQHAAAAPAVETADRKPLIPSDGGKKKNEEGNAEVCQVESGSLVGYALLAGVAIDAIDVVSCLVCFLQGDLPLQAALLCGGAGGLALGIGAYGYMARPWKIRG